MGASGILEISEETVKELWKVEGLHRTVLLFGEGVENRFSVEGFVLHGIFGHLDLEYLILINDKFNLCKCTYMYMICALKGTCS